MTYAAQTNVSTDRTIGQIRTMLEAAGAEKFGYLQGRASVELVFELHERRIRYAMPMPAIGAYQWTEQGRERTLRTQREQWQKAQRARWRALHLLIRAKLEAVELKVISVDEAFLAETVMPDNRSVAEWVIPGLTKALPVFDVAGLLAAGAR